MVHARPAPRPGAYVLTLLLDLDGTLTDPRDGIVRSLRFALRALGAPVPPEAELARCIGPPLGDSFRALLPDPTAARVAAAIDQYRVRFDRIGWRENRVYAGVPGFLAAVRERGFRTVVATSKPRVFAQRIARHFELDAQLDAIYGAELDGTRGRKPELLAHVLTLEGVAPERAVMVGDRRHDVEGARAHGLRSLGVTYGYGDRDELAAAGATWICDDLEEALAVLDAALDKSSGSA
jgi:phosphoglycolate phosphatase